MAKRVRRPRTVRQPRPDAVQLGVWSLRVRKRNQTDTPQRVDNFDGSGSSLRAFVLQWLKGLNSGAPRSSGRHYFRLGRVTAAGPNDLHGLLEVGTHGEKRPIYSILNGNRDFTQTRDHASCRPHFFRFHFRPESAIAVVTMEVKPGGSVYGPFAEILIDDFKDAYPEMMLFTKGVAPPELLQHLMNGGIRTIEVDRHFTPQEREERVLWRGAVKRPTKLTIKAEATGEGYLVAPLISKALKRLTDVGRNATPQLLEIPEDLGGGSGEVKVDVEYLGKSRRVNLSDTSGIRPYVDVTAEVGPRDVDGQPDFARLDDEAEGLLQSAAALLAGHS